MANKSIKISCDIEALQIRGVTIDGVKFYLEYLSKTFKGKFSEIISTNIIDLSTLDTILMLYEILSKLEGVEGFERHVKEYNQSQLLSTLFVSRLALFLKEKVDDMELEPITPENEGNPDIRIFKNGYNVFIECKNIETEQFNDLEEHRRIFNTLSQYIEVPHQIIFFYSATPNEDELNKLGENIKKLIPHVKVEGNIINNENYTVHVHPRSHFGDPSITVEMTTILGDNNSGERVPGHVFMIDGKTFAVNGPDIDYKKVLIEKVKRARKQSVSNSIFITAINTDAMLGSINENIRSIESLFQPNQNTRFSSVLFANSESIRGNEKWLQIINPYAENPITNEIQGLFAN